MKNHIYILVLAGILSLAACSKTGSSAYKGHYSFKTGGSIDITGKRCGIVDTTITRRLPAESGQMHIVEKGNGAVLITMNVTGGDSWVMQANVSGNRINIENTRRFVPVYDKLDVLYSYFDMTVSGSGERYDNMIILNLVYQGAYKELDFEGTVTESRINCVARENE